MSSTVERKPNYNSPINLDVLDIDTDRAVSDPRDASLRVDASRASFVAHDSNARGEEVASVGVSLEGDQVAAEHSIQDGFAACEKKGVSTR